MSAVKPLTHPWSSPRPSPELIGRSFPEADTPDYPSSQLTRAYYMAGRAVLCRLIGMDINHHKIEAADSAGKVVLPVDPPKESTSPTPARMQQAATLQLATIYMGGVTAELLLHGLDVTAEHCHSMKSLDGRRARAVLRSTFNSEDSLYYCQRLARALLSEQWEWVTLAAKKIHKEGSISTASIDEMGRRSVVALPVEREEWGYPWKH